MIILQCNLCNHSRLFPENICTPSRYTYPAVARKLRGDAKYREKSENEKKQIGFLVAAVHRACCNESRSQTTGAFFSNILFSLFPPFFCISTLLFWIDFLMKLETNWNAVAGKLINQIIINTAHVKGTLALTRRTSLRNLSYFRPRGRYYFNLFLFKLIQFYLDCKWSLFFLTLFLVFILSIVIKIK